jgi:hypothetical protein
MVSPVAIVFAEKVCNRCMISLRKRIVEPCDYLVRNPVRID